ncbi:hypothetical protein O0I10_000756 [Lichtheimia ornata]|uniref:Pentacotripeptide-repeat region of PRORP domain-containing protein n=1 Tax=Lichtheimia ornata TaxID=688661 RepID=A0AAD7Y4B7_9FUNG|nr:uncharacterized protein O0I10_000756 [Lichtheimia ornata]KAJ8663514.1 hypothetical protein O0I10_000756 [Lichtheimia ornata]
MRNVTGRTTDLLIQSLIPNVASITTRLTTRVSSSSSSSSPLSRIARCSGCGCPIRTSTVNRPFWSDMSRRWITTSHSNNHSVVAAAKLDPIQYLNVSISELLLKGRAADALYRYMRLVQYHKRMPPHETLYQLCHGLYRSHNLRGLYAVHDTLLLYYKERPMSRRRRRIMLYLNTMIINLVSKSSSRQLSHRHQIAEPPTRIIEQLCREMTDLKLTPTKHVAVFNSILNMLVQHGQVDNAWILFDHMRQDDINPSARTYSIMLKTVAQTKDLHAADQLLEDMHQRGIATDQAIVGGLVTALCRRNAFTTAQRLVDQMYYYSNGDPRLMSTETRARLLAYISKWEKQRHKKRLRLKAWSKNAKRRKQQHQDSTNTHLEEEIKV